MAHFINRVMLLFTDKDCYGNNIYNFDGNKQYYEIIKKVRNFATLDDSELEFIKNLPQKELVSIIELYNIYSERINDYFIHNDK